MLAASWCRSIGCLLPAAGHHQTDLDIPARFGYFPHPHFYREPIATEPLAHPERRMASDALPRAGVGPFARIRDLILPAGIIASVLVIMVPLPAGLMDVLLEEIITVAVIILLTTIYVGKPL